MNITFPILTVISQSVSCQRSIWNQFWRIERPSFEALLAHLSVALILQHLHFHRIPLSHPHKELSAFPSLSRLRHRHSMYSISIEWSVQVMTYPCCGWLMM